MNIFSFKLVEEVDYDNKTSKMAKQEKVKQGKMDMKQNAFQEADKIAKIADILKVIAHPIRLKIVEGLQGGEERTVSYLAKYVDAEQSLVSHHLTKMKDKGVLRAKREGKNIYYQLADEKITKVFDCIGNCDFF